MVPDGGAKMSVYEAYYRRHCRLRDHRPVDLPVHCSDPATLPSQLLTRQGVCLCTPGKMGERQ